MEKDEALLETIAILETIPGGSEVIEWFGGWPEFGDAEVLELRLVRRGKSLLRVSAEVSEAGKWRGPPFKHAVFDFTLRDMIDVYLDGFSHQNVIGGLTLHPTQNQPVHQSLQGTGLTRGEVEIELGPVSVRTA